MIKRNTANSHIRKQEAKCPMNLRRSVHWLAASGCKNLASLPSEDIDDLIEAVRLATFIKLNPRGDELSNKAYAAGRKWAIRTAKGYGTDALPRRLDQALAGRVGYREIDAAYFTMATVAR